MQLKLSYAKGLSFGIASGIITTLGMMVGLYSSTGNKTAVLGAILTIAVADALSDAFGIHLSEKSGKVADRTAVWESTAATFVAKLIFASTFVMPVMIFSLHTAIVMSIIWGLFLLAAISILIAQWREESKIRMIAEHWFMAILVIVLTYYIGLGIANTFVEAAA